MVSAKKHPSSIWVLVSLFVIFGVVAQSQNGSLHGSASAGQPDLLGADGKINLRILCTTSPKEGRTDDFVKFLNEHFVKVATTDYESFREDLARDFDVVIIDYGTTRPGSPVPEQLSRGYSRATVTVGVAGSEVGRRLGLKTGYLWNCMSNAAHGESLDHEVYRMPFKVEPKFENLDTPDNYFDRHLGTDKLPDKMKVWRVQSSERGNVVCRAYGFEDSPDAEVIAQGFNHGKEYGAVGIGRHGNVLQWGYGDPPSQMTEAGRKLFLNCICYIYKFDGRPPLVHRTSGHRLNAVRLALLIDQIDDKSFFSSTFTPEQMAKYKGNAQGLADFYRQNLELVRRDKTFVLDSELQDLGLSSNRTVETLDKLIGLLGDPKHAGTAGRLLARYTHELFSSPQQWRGWFDDNKDKFYFSDVGGYQFFVVPEGYPVGRKNQTAIGKVLYR